MSDLNTVIVNPLETIEEPLPRITTAEIAALVEPHIPPQPKDPFNPKNWELKRFENSPPPLEYLVKDLGKTSNTAEGNQVHARHWCFSRGFVNRGRKFNPRL